MTQSDQSNICPRCGQKMEVRVRAATIKPHRDPLMGGPCPTEGMLLAEARQWVAEARAAIKAMAT